MTIDQKGKDLIAECEGLKLKPYLCAKGVATIGIGSTFYEDEKPVKLIDKPITIDRAWGLFEKTKVNYEKAVNDSVKVDLTQSQFNALFVFTYNVGASAFKKSTLLKRVNAGCGYDLIKEAFLMWKGKKDLLLTRRKKEINEYFRK